MIEISTEAVERVRNILSGVPGGAQKALSAAMNRGISKVKTSALKQVRTVYAVQYSAMKAATNTRTKTTSAGNLAGYVSFSGFKIPLYKFSVNPKVAGTRKQVTAGVMKGGATAFEDAFVATMSSGHTGIFERTGTQGIKDRLEQGNRSKHTEKVSEIMGLSAAQMIQNVDVMGQIEADAQETVNQRLEHEIDRILNGYGGK